MPEKLNFFQTHLLRQLACLMSLSSVPVLHDQNLTCLPSSELCPLYFPSSEACIWLETRDPHSPQQWVRDAERPGLEYRVWGSRGGRESAGQVGAGHHLLQNSCRPHYHPRYYSLIPPPSIHTQQPQCVKASTVTRRALLFGSLIITRCLFKACWLCGLTWLICLCL